jgi:hypothetical protein
MKTPLVSVLLSLVLCALFLCLQNATLLAQNSENETNFETKNSLSKKLKSEKPLQFIHQLGITYSIATYPSTSNTISMLTYQPRLQLLEVGDYLSLSLNAPIGFGIGFYSDNFGKNYLETGYEAALVPTLNFGLGATKRSEGFIGGYLGGGYGLNNTRFRVQDQWGVLKANETVQGVYLHGSLVFSINNTSPIALGVYTIAGNTTTRLYGIRLQYLLGF